MSLRNQKIIQQFANSTANRFFQIDESGIPVLASQFIGQNGTLRFPVAGDQVYTRLQPANFSLGPGLSGSIVMGAPWFDANDASYLVVAFVTGIQSDGSAGFSGICCATFKKVGAADAVIVGTSQTIFLQEDIAGAPTINLAAAAGNQLTVNWNSGAVSCEVTATILSVRCKI